MDPEAAERAALVHEQICLQPGWADRQSTSLALREHARRYDFDTALAHCQTLRQWVSVRATTQASATAQAAADVGSSRSSTRNT